MRLRIATVLVGHEPEVYLEANEKIDRIFAEQVPNTVRTTVIVDNSLPRIEQRLLAKNVVLVGGDNSFREFTAWERGLIQLDRMRETPDLVHLATSAFDSLYTDYLARFDRRLLAAAAAARAVVGHLDHYDEEVEILGRKSQHWVRTSFFFVPPAALQAMRSILSFERPDELFGDDPDRPFRSDAPLSENYREYIRSWLTGDGTGQGVVWHSRFELGAETLDLFRTKALAIVNEHMITVRLQELGYPVVDVTWLANRLATGDPSEIDWHTPWHRQVAERFG